MISLSLRPTAHLPQLTGLDCQGYCCEGCLAQAVQLMTQPSLQHSNCHHQRRETLQQRVSQTRWQPLGQPGCVLPLRLLQQLLRRLRQLVLLLQWCVCRPGQTGGVLLQQVTALGALPQVTGVHWQPCS